MPKILFHKAVLSIVAFALIYHLIALGLIFSQFPEENAVDTEKTTKSGLDFSDILSATSTARLPDLQSWKAREGATLYYRQYLSTKPTNKTLVLLHGSGWHSQQFVDLASNIAKSGTADVITPDLRGHGIDPQTRGDVSYIGQFEEDLADLFAELKITSSDKKLYLGGHSSGGGLVVRFAGGQYGKQAAGFILLAPYLKYNAPTTRANSGGWARPLTRRIIGLSLLNQMGITSLNALPVIQFNFPQTVLNGPLGMTATTQYSYRLNTSYAPRDEYETDLAAMKQPFLLIAGSEDEAFVADQYEPVISAKTKSGQYRIIEGQGHLGIVKDKRVFTAVNEWLINN